LRLAEADKASAELSLRLAEADKASAEPSLRLAEADKASTEPSLRLAGTFDARDRFALDLYHDRRRPFSINLLIIKVCKFKCNNKNENNMENSEK
jgi:hypothetical protein